MTEELIGKLLIASVTGGFSLLTIVIGFFARRLVNQHDEHAKRLGRHEGILANHERRLEVAETRLSYVEDQRA